MSAPKIRGIIPLQWGTDVTSGYVTETEGEDTTTKEEWVLDEQGNEITQISQFGIKTDVTLEVIPKSTTTLAPAVGIVFAYGASGSIGSDGTIGIKNITIISINAKKSNRGVMKWTIKGNYVPGITLTVGS